jgi:hypothetical protein
MTTASEPIKRLALANPVEPGSLREVAVERADDLLAALRANQVTTHPLPFSHRRWQVTSGARAALIAVVVVLVALALVPIGGASLGSRAVDGISSLWETPPNQPALDRAAEDAGNIAGQAYYTDARVNDEANKVDLYLARAPQLVIDELQAKHPGTYVINNDAAHPLSQLLKLQRSISFQALQSKGIDVVESYPTSDGYLKVGVRGKSDVQAAQSALDSMFGAGIIKVFGGAEPMTFGGSGQVHRRSSRTEHHR